MVSRGASREEEFFNEIERFRRQPLKQTQAERLRNRRVDAIERSQRTRNFRPNTARLRKQPPPRIGEFDAGKTLGAFQSF